MYGAKRIHPAAENKEPVSSATSDLDSELPSPRTFAKMMASSPLTNKHLLAEEEPTIVYKIPIAVRPDLGLVMDTPASSPSSPDRLKKDTREDEVDPQSAKKIRKLCFPTDGEIGRGEILFCAVWESKTTDSGRWSLRASRRKGDSTNSPDLFVLEAINLDCGVFRTILALPFDAWSEKMEEVGDRISELFQKSRCWLDILSVNKTLDISCPASKAGPFLRTRPLAYIMRGLQGLLTLNLENGRSKKLWFLWGPYWGEPSYLTESLFCPPSPGSYYYTDPYHLYHLPPPLLHYSSSESSPALSPSSFLIPSTLAEEGIPPAAAAAAAAAEDCGNPAPSYSQPPAPAAEDSGDPANSSSQPLTAKDSGDSAVEDPGDAAPSNSLQEYEIDGWIPSTLIANVKTTLLHLFSLICVKYVKETCYGGITDHPSQRQHQCLEIPEEDYYQLHFHRITQRLLTPRFIPAVQNLLRLRRIQAEDAKVKMIAETVLHELKSTYGIQTAITDMYQDMNSEENPIQLCSV